MFRVFFQTSRLHVANHHSNNQDLKRIFKQTTVVL